MYIRLSKQESSITPEVPQADFQMHTTLDQESGLQVVPLWINGGPAIFSKTTTFPVYSASQQKNVYLARSADTEAAIEAAEAAQKAFRTWRETSCASRRGILLRLADIIKERQAELVNLQVEETSCSETWAQFNISYTLNALPEIASRITTVCSGELPPMANAGTTMGLVIKEPIGPVLLIAP